MVYQSVVLNGILKGLPFEYHSMVLWPMVYSYRSMVYYSVVLNGIPKGLPLRYHSMVFGGILANGI